MQPYDGIGSTVLKPGTVLKEPYKGPQSVLGVLDIGGVWIVSANNSPS